MPAFDSSDLLIVGRSDDLLFDVTLEETNATTGVTAALTTGTVTAHLSLWPPSATALGSSSTALTHVASGRWVGALDTSVVTSSLADLPDGTRLAVVYSVSGAMARYREARVQAIRRSDPLT